MSANLIGQILLDQFRVDAFIASGGMGAVYRVWDLKRNTPLAMKVLHSELAEDPSAFKSFQREARALEKLAHPNIVSFYGVYQTLDFTFLLERFIDGPSLKDILRQRQGQPLPVSEALIYLKALCAALGYAHANGVVHCDVKPGNVMMDRGGNVFLTDFGIARHAESTTTTLAGAGAPAYMAPEQIRGKVVTPATDIYALGVILFEMLIGQRPFRGNKAGTEKGSATANGRIRYAHLHLPPPDPRGLNPSISETLAGVILKALDKKPPKRYQSVQEFFVTICTAIGVTPDKIADRVVLSDLPVPQAIPALPPAPPREIPIPPSRSTGLAPWLLGGGAVLAIGCVIAVVAALAAGLPSGSDSAPILPAATEYRPPTLLSEAEMALTATISSALTQAAVAQWTVVPTPTLYVPPTTTPRPSVPSGKIVYTCQVYGKYPDQICIMNADGSGIHQLTDNGLENFYASLAPDGGSIVYVSKRTTNFEIYEMSLSGGEIQLTYDIGDLYAPEISPDGYKIVFTNDYNSYSHIWVMNRDGSNPYEVYSVSGEDALDASWTPDGQQILFAFGAGEKKQLYIINRDGSGLRRVNSSFYTRGRSDWSPDGSLIAAYSGEKWHREIFIMKADGSDLHQISNGGNVQAPSFSLDGQWIAFTGYTDNYGDENGCEIYIMRIDGSDIRRLTNNDYCDYQPSWGPSGRQ